METKLIECKLIDVPKTEANKRSFSKEFATTLADTIKLDGQLQAVILRTNPADPSRFILVTGKHRFFAMKKVLKEQFILASVDDKMSAEEAEAIADVENLWRNPLTKTQHVAAQKRWHRSFMDRYAQTETVATALPAPAPAPEAEPSTPNQSDGVSEPVDAGTAPEKKQMSHDEQKAEKAFNAHAASITGQSVASIRRAKAIGNAFTDEQLEVFIHMEINQTDMLTISRIKDVAKRGEVVSLVASGMEVADAIKQIMGEESPERYGSDSAGAVAADAKAATKAVREPDLSDDDWFNLHCGEKAAMLGDTTKFKADAILFRNVADLRHAFRTKSKKFMADTKAGGSYSSFYNLIKRFLSISHPKDWFLCPECKGQTTVGTETLDSNGITIPAQKCPKCFGAGFLLKTEEI